MRWFWPFLWGMNALIAGIYTVHGLFEDTVVPTFVYVAAGLVFLDRMDEDWPR